jgi:hypothetical protein
MAWSRWKRPTSAVASTPAPFGPGSRTLVDSKIENFKLNAASGEPVVLMLYPAKQ